MAWLNSVYRKRSE